jgi:hypothetical protein
VALEALLFLSQRCIVVVVLVALQLHGSIKTTRKVLADARDNINYISCVLGARGL